MDQDGPPEKKRELLISRNPWLRVLTYFIMSLTAGVVMYLILSDYTVEGLQPKNHPLKEEIFATLLLKFGPPEFWFWVGLFGTIVVMMFLEKSTYNFKKIEDESDDDSLE